ncbi:MAG: carboxypeptidase-like regulatory domain-containing protein [Bacteroidales bacterium]
MTGIIHKAFRFRSVLAVIFMITVMLISSCEKYFYTEPIEYPVTIAFSGVVLSEDTIPLANVNISFRAPGDPDSVATFTDVNGKYHFKQLIENVGPHRLTVQDIDGGDNGGSFMSQDTVFYLNKSQWDSRSVEIDFMLKKI